MHLHKWKKKRRYWFNCCTVLWCVVLCLIIIFGSWLNFFLLSFENHTKAIQNINPNEVDKRQLKPHSIQLPAGSLSKMLLSVGFDLSNTIVFYRLVTLWFDFSQKGTAMIFRDFFIFYTLYDFSSTLFSFRFVSCSTGYVI